MRTRITSRALDSLGCNCSSPFPLFFSPKNPPMHALTQKESPLTIQKSSPFSFLSKKSPPMRRPPSPFSSFTHLYIYHLPNPKSAPERKIPYFFSSFLLILFSILQFKSNLPNFKFLSKTFQGESHFP